MLPDEVFHCVNCPFKFVTVLDECIGNVGTLQSFHIDKACMICLTFGECILYENSAYLAFDSPS